MFNFGPYLETFSKFWSHPKETLPQRGSIVLAYSTNQIYVSSPQAVCSNQYPRSWCITSGYTIINHLNLTLDPGSNFLSGLGLSEDFHPCQFLNQHFCLSHTAKQLCLNLDRLFSNFAFPNSFALNFWMFDSSFN